MPLDDELLRSQQAANKDEESSADESAERAGALREAQNNQGGGNQEVDGSLRSRVMAAKKEKNSKKDNLNEDKKSISFVHSQRLKFNILNLVTSWGTSFFYIVYHWFQSKLGNKRKYVKLGSEWMDTPGMTEKQRDEIGSNFAPWESCCFVSLSIGCLVALFLAFIPIVLMGYFLADPVGFTTNFFTITWHIFKFIFVDMVSSIF